MTQSIQDCINNLQVKLDNIDSINWIDWKDRKFEINDLQNSIRDLQIAARKQPLPSPTLVNYNYDEIDWENFEF